MHHFPPPQLPPPPPLPPPQSSTFTPPPYYSHTTPTPTTTPPAQDLPTALSSLISLLNLSSTTLHSLPIPFFSSPTPTLIPIPCPFNPNHLLPPSSLFSHYLNCPHPISSNTLIQNLKYPTTLHSSNPFTLQDSQKSELCFSLEPYLDNLEENSFFYSDSPGVVSFPIKGDSFTPPMLTLPVVLSSQCAHLNQPSMALSNDESIQGFLPSEVYAIRNETDCWNENDFPLVYSYRVLRAILGLGLSSVECLCMWVVDSSARCYGIVLDLVMRDHILVLFKLCLKAIVREALDLASMVGAEGLVLSDRSFKCPVFVQVLVWLATQLSMLYGEMNGKLFAISMLKKCICDCAFSSCMFVESSNAKKEDDNLQEPLESGGQCKSRIVNKETNGPSETLCKSEIFVSQVAAAVAALHERSMLEGKLKALRNLPSLPAYQRSREHAYISSKADEERQIRPNYRALLEHDGLLWQHSRNNQDTNRPKTAEELLAEERDYKRRRMSYRGKKLKRSTTEVMRDIIEEYMEVIRQAGGINNPTKGAEEAESPLSATYQTDNYYYMDKAEYGKRQTNSSSLTKGKEGGYRKEFKDDYSERSNRRSRQDTKDYYRSANQRENSVYLRETISSQKKRDYSKYSRDYYSRSSSRSYHKSSERSSSHRERSDHNSDFRKRKSRDASYDFEDRYDPSES